MCRASAWLPGRTIGGGDAQFLLRSLAASIFAKVTRDRYMRSLPKPFQC